MTEGHAEAALAELKQLRPEGRDERLTVLAGLLTSCIWTTNAEGMFEEL